MRFEAVKAFFVAQKFCDPILPKKVFKSKRGRILTKNNADSGAGGRDNADRSRG